MTTTSPFTSPTSSPVRATRKLKSRAKADDDSDFELTIADVANDNNDSDSDSDFQIIGSSSRVTTQSKPASKTGRNSRRSIKRSVISEDEEDDLEFLINDSDDEDDVKPKSKSTRRKAPNKRTKLNPAAAKVLSSATSTSTPRPHSPAYHSTDRLITLLPTLLNWFSSVRETRGMPWRKPYDDTKSMVEKGQRAYEIWVSEVMLQQTQYARRLILNGLIQAKIVLVSKAKREGFLQVIPYWTRWLEKWPTIADLAKADIEEVNNMWRGLGYYRRAKNLLLGSQRIVNDPKRYQGRLPDDPVKLEKDVEGVGRYTAGAICSMAYGVKTPIVDGNVHRLLSRLLALHAPPTSPTLIKALWGSAEELVRSLDDDPPGLAGDLNQALMELGSQVCKPTSPDCASCPLRSACKGYEETRMGIPPSSAEEDEECTICSPLPAASASPEVTIFPMKKVAKAQREESCAVLVVKWMPGEGVEDDEPRWLFVKRPEEGLLAGLFEPPCLVLEDPDVTSSEAVDLARSNAAKYMEKGALDESKLESGPTYHGEYVHVFSHIRMTYRLWEIQIDGPLPAIRLPKGRTAAEVVWLTAAALKDANVGTGVKKMWELLKGTTNPWTGGKGGTKPAKRAATKKKAVVEATTTVKKKVLMMPMMPSIAAGSV